MRQIEEPVELRCLTTQPARQVSSGDPFRVHRLIKTDTGPAERRQRDRPRASLHPGRGGHIAAGIYVAREGGLQRGRVPQGITRIGSKVVHRTINVDEPDPDGDLDYLPGVGRRIDIEHAVASRVALGSKNSALLLRHIWCCGSPSALT